MTSANLDKIILIFIALALMQGCASINGNDKNASESGQDEPYVEISIRGLKELSERSLKRAAADELIVLERGGKEWQADDAAFAMEEFYRLEGFHKAKVEYTLSGIKPYRVMFTVDEGPRAILGSIGLLGRGEVERKKLTPFFKGPTTAWVGGATLYVKDNVEGAAKLILSWFKAEGYLVAEVDPPSISFKENDEIADVEVTIRPGPRFIICSIRYRGIEEEYFNDAMAALENPIGSSFISIWPARAEKKLVAFFRERGFFRPEVLAEVIRDDETGDVDIVFDVKTGLPHTFGTIDFSGYDRTEQGFLHSMITMAPGEQFDGRKLIESTTRLYGAGLFSSVEIKEIVRNNEIVDIAYTVEERDAKDVSFMVGYGSYEIVRGAVKYTDRNLFGRGLNWSSGLRASFKSIKAETSITDPFFLNLPLEGALETYTARRAAPSFTEEDYGVVASLAKQWTGSFNTKTGYSLSKSRLREVDSDLEALGGEGSFTLGSVFLRFALDYRDSWVIPHRGALNEITFETADEILGSDISFNRVTGRSVWHFPLDEDEKWIAAFGAKGGIMVRKSETDIIPLQQRFFNGGEDSVRSFQQDELGPMIGNDPIGGEFYTVGSLELRYPLWKQLGGVLFADAGNLKATRSEADFRGYRYAIGTGLRYYLPIGPIRLDWGWNPNPRDDEEHWALHLSVGFAF